MKIGIHFNTGRPHKDGEYLVIEKSNGKHRFHTYDFTVEGGWNSFRDNEGNLVPKGVDYKYNNSLFEKDIIGWTPTKISFSKEIEDSFEDVADDIEYLMDYFEESEPEVYEGLADALDKFMDAKDWHERGSEE